MVVGTRKEYLLKKNESLPLENYTAVFLHNQGSSKVTFNNYELEPDATHRILTNGVAITENIEISFDSKVDNRLYLEVISAKPCE